MGLICGSFLEKPITDKESSDETNGKLSCGISSMQGWRTSQEDAHNCILDYDTNTNFFAVYDGHGGHEVAEYCADKLPDFIKNTEEYKQGKYSEALTAAFLDFDATIILPETKTILTQIAIQRDRISDDSYDTEDETSINNLYEEAAMPIEKVMEKYKNIVAMKSESKKESIDLAGKSSSPSSSSAQPCSSSASSSFQQCDDGVSSSNEAGPSDKNCKFTEAVPEASSSETNIVPDSSDTKEAEATETTPKKDEKTTGNNEVSTPNSEEQEKNDEKTVENGSVSKKGKQKARITPQSLELSPKTKPKANAQQLYKTWLEMGNISDSEETSDEDDEEDESFEAPHEDSSEDEGEGVNVAIECDDSDESSGGEEEVGVEKEDDDDDEEDEDEKDDDCQNNVGPGVTSGCTAIVALLKEQELIVANAGDCRCVVSRNGKAIAMSFDHKPKDRKEGRRIRKAGGRVSMDGRVNDGLNLSRAIGDHFYKLRKDLSNIQQMVIALPDIQTLSLTSEDEFMVLACDGIWNSMTNQEVVDFIRPRLKEGDKKLSEICEEMFDYCLAPDSIDTFGCDNMTALIIKFNSISAKRPSSSDDVESISKKAKTEHNEGESQIDTTTS